MVPRDLSLRFVCPVCEAAPQERCHVNVRIVCFESHWERKDLATDALLNAVSEGKLLEFPDVHRIPRRWAS
jgi:hypothetical protein